MSPDRMLAFQSRIGLAATTVTVVAAALAAASLESRFALVSAADMDGGSILGLEADDFVVEDGGALAEVISVTPASYPIAVVVDTSSFARSDFQQIREAVHQFVGALSGRDVALYATGMLPKRRVELTRDLRQLETSLDSTFAQPEGPGLTLDAIGEAAKDLGERHDALTRIVVVSAGGSDSSGESPRDVLHAVVAGRSIVDVIDLQQAQTRGTPRNSRGLRSTIPSLYRADNDAARLRYLSRRTLGTYERIVTASGYATALQKVRSQILSEVIVEYAAVPGSAHSLRVGIHLPNVVVRGIALERSPDARP
jgi:hypothetical protein